MRNRACDVASSIGSRRLALRSYPAAQDDPLHNRKAREQEPHVCIRPLLRSAVSETTPQGTLGTYDTLRLTAVAWKRRASRTAACAASVIESTTPIRTYLRLPLTAGVVSHTREYIEALTRRCDGSAMLDVGVLNRCGSSGSYW